MISTTHRKVQYEGTGSQTVFPITFPFRSKEDVHAIVTDRNGADSYITNNFAVEAVSNGYNFVYPVTGDALTLGSLITIYRETPLTQDTDLLNGGNFNADEVELALDINTMQMQEAREIAGRVVTVPITEQVDFAQLVDNLLTAAQETETNAGFVREMAGTFESATETQRGVSYLASNDEVDAGATASRSPDGPAVLDVEKGVRLAQRIADEKFAGIGLDSATIGRLGTVRIAKDSEVQAGVTDTGREPATLTPESHAAAHAADGSLKIIDPYSLVKSGTGYFQIGNLLFCYGHIGGITTTTTVTATFAKAFASNPVVVSAGITNTLKYAYSGNSENSPVTIGSIYSGYNTSSLYGISSEGGSVSMQGIIGRTNNSLTFATKYTTGGGVSITYTSYISAHYLVVGEPLEQI